MPPDRVSELTSRGLRTGLFDRSIPPTRRIETRERRDNQVSVQVGAFVAMPVVGIVLILRPDAAEAVLAAAGLVITAMRQSYVRYQRIRWT